MRSLARKLRPVKLRLSLFYWMVGVAILIALSLWVTSWGLRVSQDWATLQQQPTDATKKQFDASLDVVKAIVSGVGTIATIGGGVFVLWNLRLTQTRLITERFSKAVEQLGNDKIEVRLGGIYALERIAYDSDRDHWTIMEVLTSFIQEKSPIEEISEEQIRAKAYEIWQHSNGSGTEQEHWDTAIRELEVKPVTKDVQAALTVIGRRQKKDPPDKRLDLSNTNLRRVTLREANLQKAVLTKARLQQANLTKAQLQGAVLEDAQLQGAVLEDAQLQGAVLSKANLQKAVLKDAKLQQANLWAANLQGADLMDAKLQQANLTKADLKGAYLVWANLQQADLKDANLQGADLTKANLQQANLESAQLQQANLWVANLQQANLEGANLQGADLESANLQQADLKDANLQENILILTDLRNTENFDPNQLGGEHPPILCNVALPKGFLDKDKLKDRDCDRLPQELLKRYPQRFDDIEDAKQYVDEHRQKQWE